MFVNRQVELVFLNDVLARKRPTAAQLILLYGRRRVGKTVLLRHWAENSGLSHTYWAAEKEPAALQRRKLFARVLASSQPGQPPLTRGPIVGRLSLRCSPAAVIPSSWTSLPMPPRRIRRCCHRFNTPGINY
jgi:hypothetical protein